MGFGILDNKKMPIQDRLPPDRKTLLNIHHLTEIVNILFIMEVLPAVPQLFSTNFCPFFLELEASLILSIIELKDDPIEFDF